MAKEDNEAILTSVPDAVIVLDENRQPIHANQAGSALLQEASRQGVDLFPPDLLERPSTGSLPSEKAVLDVLGRSYQALASPMQAGQQKNDLVVVFRDVTRFQELDRMKTKFVTDVSHELRTPLTNLNLYVELVSMTDEPARRGAYIDTLRRETQRLTHLIDDLLTISRMETGRLELYLKDVDVNRVVVDMVTDRTIIAAQKGLSLSYELAENLPFAYADARMLNQCLSNLLTNAINYTPEDGRIVLRTAQKSDEDILWIKVEVQDTGLGIASDEMPNVFRRFFRGSASVKTGAPGIGLGLAISKEIVERMQGQLTMDSVPNMGSTFSIWLRAVL
jgi:signal transduction histidine kinase